jgi:diguanylate cyclase (GGDEF)-like protein
VHDSLPVPLSPYGPLGELALRVHDLTIRGHHTETLIAADQAEAVATALGDFRTARTARQGRMYALIALGRLDEALTIGEELSAVATGPRSSDAKLLADTANVLIRLGRVDDGLHYLARAIGLLQDAPRSQRYVSALSSVCGAAQVADLFELADDCMRVAVEWFAASENELYRSSAELQHAELLLEWALRLEQVGRDEEAASLYERSVTLLSYWAERGLDAPLGSALLAVGYAKTGLYEQARGLVDELLLAMRRAGQWHESRLLHLAHGVALRANGELRAARREFLAAEGLTVHPSQKLLFQYELAVTAVHEAPGEATHTLLRVVHSQLQALWRVRMDRRTMLRQAARRVELEAARINADLAATSDALTGLGNRRMFDHRINAVQAPGALLLIDVDRFKRINDTFSHGVGDRVLGEIAAVLRAHCRHDEVAIRFGGDEFALFLKATPAEATEVAERIRQVILARDWSTIAAGLRVTLSMGLAASAQGVTGAELYDKADRNLYSAKNSGRNQLAAA